MCTTLFGEFSLRVETVYVYDDSQQCFCMMALFGYFDFEKLDMDKLLTDVDVAVISDDIVAEPRGQHGEAGQQQRRAPPPRPRPHGGRRSSEYLKQMGINVGVMKQWVARWRPAPAQNKLTVPLN